MKIACVDKTAADRLKLQQFLDEAFSAHRGVIGHLPQASSALLSLEELLFGSRPEIALIGPAFGVEESFSICRQLRDTFPALPLVVLFAEENYSLRVLRRFERFSKALFAANEPSARLIHTLFEMRGEQAQPPKGKLVAVSGVKGGVGATSYVAGLAHAAQATGHRAIAVDLSAAAALLHYMGAARMHCAEYSTILNDCIRPQKELVERLIIAAPNGVSLLLPPPGGREMRELWLRDRKRFELSLEIVEFLLEMFDLVIVDLANTEGILPFALLSQADVRILFTSNEPAAVHLLHRQLGELAEIPGDGKLAIVMNALLPSGLTAVDVFDFVLSDSPLQDALQRLPSLPHDQKAKHWIGTGNSLYTEGSRQLQSALESHIKPLLSEMNNSVELRTEQSLRSRFSGITSFVDKLSRGGSLIKENVFSERNTTMKRISWSANESHESDIMRPATAQETGSQSERGSLALEQMLFISGAIIVAAVAVPEFLRAVLSFLSNFSDGG